MIVYTNHCLPCGKYKTEWRLLKDCARQNKIRIEVRRVPRDQTTVIAEGFSRGLPLPFLVIDKTEDVPLAYPRDSERIAIDLRGFLQEAGLIAVRED